MQLKGYHICALQSDCKKQNNKLLTIFMASVHTNCKCSSENVQYTILSDQSDFHENTFLHIFCIMTAFIEKMSYSIFPIIYSAGRERTLKLQQNKDNYIQYMYVHLRRLIVGYTLR